MLIEFLNLNIEKKLNFRLTEKIKNFFKEGVEKKNSFYVPYIQITKGQNINFIQMCDVNKRTNSFTTENNSMMTEVL